MKYTRLVISLLWLLLVAVVVASAQGAITISRCNLGGGGDIATGGNVYLHGALGQAVAGPSTGGNFKLMAGFWSGGMGISIRTIYLPVVLKSFTRYAPVCSAGNKYCEDYDAPETAYGPVEPGVAYRAYPEDEKDYYYFLVLEPASITVRVTNYSAVGWLIVRKDDPDKTPIRWDEKDPGGDDTLEVILLEQDLSPGNKYYIQIYTESNYNAYTLYSLTVSE